MATTFDLNTNVGKVRNIIGDSDTSDAHFTDEQISSFLTIQSNDLFLTSAMALRSMAANKAFIEKARRAGNYWEDTKGISKALLAAAEKLEVMAREAPAEAVADVVYTDFNYNDILIKKSLRGELPDV